MHATQERFLIVFTDSSSSCEQILSVLHLLRYLLAPHVRIRRASFAVVNRYSRIVRRYTNMALAFKHRFCRQLHRALCAYLECGLRNTTSVRGLFRLYCVLLGAASPCLCVAGTNESSSSYLCIRGAPT